MTKSYLCLFAAGLLLPIGALAENLSPQLKLNGYATAGVAWLDDDSGGAAYMQNSYGRAGITEDINTKFDSVVGIQLDYQVNEQTNLVTQLVAQGQRNFDIQADWAYIRYAFNDNWIGRAGRLGFPGFMYSDSMLIGHSYPWARLPAEVYANTPVPSVQGADITYRTHVGDWMLSGQLFGGNAETSDGRLGLDNVASAYVSASTDNLTLRAGYINFTLANKVSLAPLPNLDVSKDSSFSSYGMIYDNNQWLLAAELVQQRVHDWPADFDAGYVTVGHYFGKWLPYMTWSKIDTIGETYKTKAAIGGTPVPVGTPINTRPASIFEQTTYSAGVRYDPKPGLSLKFQVDHITDIGRYDGIFRFPGAANTGYDPKNPAYISALLGAASIPQASSTNLYSITANVAF